MSSRAHALRRLAAWERYRRRYPRARTTRGHGTWWARARDHRRSGGAR